MWLIIAHQSAVRICNLPFFRILTNALFINVDAKYLEENFLKLSLLARMNVITNPSHLTLFAKDFELHIIVPIRKSC
jgi:hypothetical protein